MALGLGRGKGIAARGTLLVSATAFVWLIVGHPFWTGDRGAGSVVVLVLYMLLLCLAVLGVVWRPSSVVLLVTIALVVIETAGYEYYARNHGDLARYGGAGFDRRTKTDVVQELRASGIDAYPLIPPTSLRQGLDVQGRTVQPLAGGIGQAVTVYCNESGQWVIYRSDPFGFRNPPELWSRNALDVAIVGDSFAHGSCVFSGQGFADRIRHRFPATLNLGTSSNGPLTELASLLEFLPPRTPKVVLWFYFEGNDLDELQFEKQQPMLVDYVEAGRTQGLESIQPSLNAALGRFVEDQYRRIAETGTSDRTPLAELIGAKHTLPARYLGALARAIDHVALAAGAEAPDRDIDLFERALRRARDTVKGWNGQLVFVYLPSFASATGDGESADRAAVLGVTASLDIPVIDLLIEFREHDDPAALFPYRRPLHYDNEGHRLVAESVLAALHRMGLSSSFERN